MAESTQRRERASLLAAMAVVVLFLAMLAGMGGGL